MAEHIDSQDLLSSGGHVWRWGARAVSRQMLATPGVAGQSHLLTGLGGRPFAIVGRTGGPALLTATAASRAAADTAMDALSAAIQELVESGRAVTWEDDKGRTGSYLVLETYRPNDNRQYCPNADGTVTCWMTYQLAGRDLDGSEGGA